MRHVVDQNLSVILYFIRIPTRFAMIYLGSISANPRTAAFLMLLSLSLVAWAYNAPSTILKPKLVDAENFRTGDQFAARSFFERLDWPRIKSGATHAGAGLIMAVVFYTLGRVTFAGVFSR